MYFSIGRKHLTLLCLALSGGTFDYETQESLDMITEAEELVHLMVPLN